MDELPIAKTRYLDRQHLYRSVIRPLGRVVLHICLALSIAGGVSIALQYGGLSRKEALGVAILTFLITYAIGLALISRLFRVLAIVGLVALVLLFGLAFMLSIFVHHF